MSGPESGPSAGLDAIVESYESAQATSGHAELEDFLPDADHPQYRSIVVELIRVDLEYGWVRGQPKRLDDYRGMFSEVFDDPPLVAAIAFEEYRQRRRAGEDVRREEYSRKYAVDVSAWPADSWPEINCDESADNLREASSSVTYPRHHDPTGPLVWRPNNPDDPRRELSDSDLFETDALRPGGRFAGFEIVEELGQGASARVYRARQRSLANRDVVLKVTPERTVEPDRLARLQHTNIVPIYSFHQVGSLYALCMPYLGTVMLSHWVDQLRKLQSPPTNGADLLSTMGVFAGGTWRSGSTRPAQPAGQIVPKRARDMNVGLATVVNGSHAASYQETVLRLALPLARGLAHAQDQGILHLDIKPANILLTDEGRPMLLDFHLASAAGPGSPASFVIGGTLPYMSPEQVRSLETREEVDYRSDIYSFGVVLYELLTGRLPFPSRTGALVDLIPAMLSDRREVPPLRLGRDRISPATGAIVCRCLHPDPRHRYQTAHELAGDLERQLNHRPLRYAGNPSLREWARKWIKRHPRVSSGGGVTLAAGVVLALGAAVWGLQREQLLTLEARRTFASFEEQVPEAKAVLSLPRIESEERRQESNRVRTLLATYGVLESDAWRGNRLFQKLDQRQQQILEREVGQLLYLLATPGDEVEPPADTVVRGQDPDLDEAFVYNSKALSCFAAGQVPEALWRQRADLLRRTGRMTEAEKARKTLAEANATSPLDVSLNATQFVLCADFRNALPLLTGLRYKTPQDFNVWYLAGYCHFALNDYPAAEACFTACIPLRPDSYRAYYQRGVCRLKLNRFADAQDDFEAALKIKPDDAPALVSRALALDGQGRGAAAVVDLTQAIELGFPETRIYFIRAGIYDKLGEAEKATRDRQEGFERVPADARSWVSRGLARLNDAPEQALADFREALALSPRDYEAYRNIAHVLSERLDRPEEAVAMLDRLLELTADDPLAWAGRGVVLARLKRKKAAQADARQALVIRRDSLVVYQAACIDTLCAESAADAAVAALPLLAEAFVKDPALADVAWSDPDLARLRDQTTFQQLIAAARFLALAQAQPAQDRASSVRFSH